MQRPAYDSNAKLKYLKEHTIPYVIMLTPRHAFHSTLFPLLRGPKECINHLIHKLFLDHDIISILDNIEKGKFLIDFKYYGKWNIWPQRANVLFSIIYSNL